MPTAQSPAPPTPRQSLSPLTNGRAVSRWRYPKRPQWLEWRTVRWGTEGAAVKPARIARLQAETYASICKFDVKAIGHGALVLMCLGIAALVPFAVPSSLRFNDSRRFRRSRRRRSIISFPQLLLPSAAIVKRTVRSVKM